MPNHCDNVLRINGKRKDIDRFFDAVRGDKKDDGEILLIDANKIIPYPKKFADADAKRDKAVKLKGFDAAFTVKDGYNNGGYEWCIKNWGTKWGMYDFGKPKHLSHSSQVRFLTAWSPPLPLILKASRMFPELKFTLKYYEGGIGFQGEYVCKNGEVIKQIESEYFGPRGG